MSSFNNSSEFSGNETEFEPSQNYAWVPYSNLFSVTLGLLHLVTFVSSFLGNLLILSVKIFSKRGRANRKSSFLLLNLVVSDLLTSVFCILPATVQVFFHGYWMFGEFLCSVYGLLLYTGVTCSYLFMTLLAMERYFVIRKPTLRSDGVTCVTSADMWKNMHFLRVLALTSWIFCFSSNLVFFYTYAVSIPQQVSFFGTTFQAELCQNHWKTNNQFFQPIAETIFSVHLWYQILVYYAIPLLVIGTTYSLIIRKLHKAKTNKALRQDTIRSGDPQNLLTVNNNNNNNNGKNTQCALGSCQNIKASPKKCTKSVRTLDVYKKLNQSVDDTNVPMATGSILKIPSAGSKSGKEGASCSKSSENGDPSHSVSISSGGRSGKQVKGQGQITTSGRNSNKSMILRDRDRNNTVRMLISVTLCFALCSLPRHLLNFLVSYRFWSPLENTEICIVIFILFLNSALNPLIIVIFSRSIKAEIREFLVCFNNGRSKNERQFLALQSQQCSTRNANLAISTRLADTRNP